MNIININTNEYFLLFGVEVAFLGDSSASWGMPIIFKASASILHK